MARSRKPKHRTRRQKVGGVTKVAAFLTAATLATTGAVIQPSQSVQTPQALRTVHADYNPLGLVEYQVPGTGSTVPNPPAVAPDMSWLDSGVWSQISDIRALVDSDDYPATLERSGPKSGTNSVNKGAETLVSWILQDDPNTTVIAGAGGSQGALVWYEALKRLQAAGYPLENVFVVLYSDPGMPGTGILARYNADESVLTTGLKGGVRTLPSEGTYVRVVNDGDPMAFFPRDPFNALALANAIAGFVFEHGLLGNVDYSKATITVDGNVTTVVAHPYGDTVPLLVPLKLMHVPDQLVTFLNKLIRPVILAGGMYDEGHLYTTPTLQNIVRQINATFQGLRDAVQYVVKLILHQPTSTSTPPNPVTSPVDDLIHEAEGRNDEVNGTTNSPVATTNSFAASQSQTQSEPEQSQTQSEPEQSQQPAVDVQPEPPVAPKVSQEAPEPQVQKQAEVQEVKEETPKQSEPQQPDLSGNVNEPETPKVDPAPVTHEVTQNEQQDQSDKSDDDKKSTEQKKQPTTHEDNSQSSSQSRPSTTTPHNQRDDSDDSPADKSTPKPKVSKDQKQTPTPKPAVEHENQSSNNSTDSHSSDSGNDS